MADFTYVEIDATKFPREPFAGEIETDDGGTLSWRERPDIGPDAMELTRDGVTRVLDIPFPSIFPLGFGDDGVPEGTPLPVTFRYGGSPSDGQTGQ